MGTRADFYVEDKWLGSVAWDGFPEEFSDIIDLTDRREFLGAVIKMLGSRDDSSHPETGWPWPWEDSTTTDFAYVFVGDQDGRGRVLIYRFGYGPFLSKDIPDDYDSGSRARFPDMTKVQNVAWDSKRSGIILLRGGKIINESRKDPRNPDHA
jgi:hypothetical protein